MNLGGWLRSCLEPMTTYYYLSPVLDALGVMRQCVNDGNATYVAAAPNPKLELS